MIKTKSKQHKIFHSMQEFRKAYSLPDPKKRDMDSIEELAQRTADKVIKAAEKK